MPTCHYYIPDTYSKVVRQVLEAKREILQPFALSLRWVASKDSLDQDVFRLTDYSDLSTTYFEGTLHEIEKLNEQQLEEAISLRRPRQLKS